MRLIIVVGLILVSCASSTPNIRETELKNEILKLKLINERLAERYLNLAAYIDYFADECLRDK